MLYFYNSSIRKSRKVKELQDVIVIEMINQMHNLLYVVSDSDIKLVENIWSNEEIKNDRYKELKTFNMNTFMSIDAMKLIEDIIILNDFHAIVTKKYRKAKEKKI